MGRRLVLLGICAAVASWLVIAPGFASTAHGAGRADAVRRTEVCFTVHVPGEPGDHQVSGTVFSTRRSSSDATALLLLHGAVSERSAWDGAWPSVRGAPRMVRHLARAGYAVFAIDRLGYAKSPYDGSHWALTFSSYVEMTHEIVTQIRAGTYRVTTDGCTARDGRQAGHGAAKVVLAGYSSGGGISGLYATRYHDIDGVVPMVWSNQGTSEEFGQAYVTTVPQVLDGDRVNLFPDHASCVRFLFHVESIRPQLLEQLCGPAYFGDVDRLDMRSPAGELHSGTAAMQEVKATIGLVGPTPALLVFADRDTIFPSGVDGSSDVVTPEIEMWKSRCNCDLTAYIQPDAGHANWFHSTAPELFDTVVEWMRAHGL